MPANATATLTINLRTAGLDKLGQLSKELQRLGVAGGRLGAAASGMRAVSGAVRAAGTSATRTGGQLRTVEQEIDRLRRKMDQAKITERARAMLGGVPGKPRLGVQIRTVEQEMARLQALERKRAVTGEARQRLGMGPSNLTGHGFTARPRQVLGLMRDVAVAGMGVRYAFAAAGAGVNAAVGPLMDFQTALAEIRTKGGFKPDEMQAIEKAAKAIPRTRQTGTFGAIEAAQAGIELAASGLRPEAIQQQMPTVLQFAQAGDIGAMDSATVLVETMSQFGLAASDFGSIGDTLVKAANLSTISVQDMAETLKYVGPVAKSAGINLQDVATMTALLGERGIKASQAGTSTRRMILSLAEPSKMAKKALKELGTTKKDLQAGMEDLPGFLSKLDKKMQSKKMNEAQRLSITKRLFGAEAIAAVEALMATLRLETGESETAWQRYREAIGAANGDMSKTAEIMGDTLHGRMKRLKASVESAQLEIGAGLAPALEKVLPKLAGAAVAVGEWSGRNSDLVANAAIAIPSLWGLSAAASATVTAFSGIAKVSGLLGIKSLGMGAGAAFGTSFIGAALPVIAAGIAGYGIGTMIARAIDAEAIGAKLYEALHGAGAPKATGRGLGAPGTEGEISLKDAMDRDKRERAAQEDEITDPILKGIAEGSEGVPAALAPRMDGRLKIEIDNRGQVRVADAASEGFILDVGNVGGL